MQKFGEHEQATTRLNFASKSSKGKILRAVRNFNGPFITPNYIKMGREKGGGVGVQAFLTQLPLVIVCHVV